MCMYMLLAFDKIAIERKRSKSQNQVVLDTTTHLFMIINSYYICTYLS